MLEKNLITKEKNEKGAIVKIPYKDSLTIISKKGILLNNQKKKQTSTNKITVALQFLEYELPYLKLQDNKLELNILLKDDDKPYLLKQKLNFLLPKTFIVDSREILELLSSNTNYIFDLDGNFYTLDNFLPQKKDVLKSYQDYLYKKAKLQMLAISDNPLINQFYINHYMENLKTINNLSIDLVPDDFYDYYHYLLVNIENGTFKIQKLDISPRTFQDYQIKISNPKFNFSNLTYLDPESSKVKIKKHE